MRYLSICSGIEAASVAWHGLGWECAGVSEIEPFPCAVLAHHYPNVKNYGDMTKYKEWSNVGTVDLLVGGTPCQSFSVAGLRKGLDDPRGNLMLVFLGIAERFRPRWVVWENVPGVLSSAGGRDFGSFLGALGELGYGWAYRVLDAQWCRVDGHPKAVPQRRRRVFVVGCLGDQRRAAEVLFERESVCRDSPKGREARQGVAPTVASGLGASGRGFARAGESRGQDCLVASPLMSGSGHIAGHNARSGHCKDSHIIAHTLGTQCSQATEDGAGRGMPLVAACLQERDHKGSDSDTKPGHLIPVAIQDGRGIDKAQNGMGINADGAAYTVDAMATQAIAFQPRIARNGRGDMGEVVNALNAQSGASGKGDSAPCVATPMAVRRLTPVECERLQGFPDGYTAIPWRGKPSSKCPDGPRYKALGNSMATNCMEWIGRRIQAVEEGK